MNFFQVFYLIWGAGCVSTALMEPWPDGLLYLFAVATCIFGFHFFQE